MAQNDVHIHIESQQDHTFWYGTLTEFARVNSLTPGEMFDICERLERDGKVTVRGCGTARYTLREGTRKNGFTWLTERLSGSYAH